MHVLQIHSHAYINPIQSDISDLQKWQTVGRWILTSLNVNSLK